MSFTTEDFPKPAKFGTAHVHFMGLSHGQTLNALSLREGNLQLF